MKSNKRIFKRKEEDGSKPCFVENSGALREHPSSSLKSKPNFEWTTGKVLAVALVAIVGILGITAMVVSSHPYIFKIEMDDNTLKAVQNITSTADRVSGRQTAFQGYNCSLWHGAHNENYTACCYPDDVKCSKKCVYPVAVYYEK